MVKGEKVQGEGCCFSPKGKYINNPGWSLRNPGDGMCEGKSREEECG